MEAIYEALILAFASSICLDMYLIWKLLDGSPVSLKHRSFLFLKI